jgi:hypothetical protein
MKKELPELFDENGFPLRTPTKPSHNFAEIQAKVNKTTESPKQITTETEKQVEKTMKQYTSALKLCSCNSQSKYKNNEALLDKEE